MNRTKQIWFVMALALALTVVLGARALGQQTPSNSAERRSTMSSDVSPIHPYFGIAAVPVHPALVEQLPDVFGKANGVLVASVLPGSPAEKAGLKIHDVLITYDGKDLSSPEQLVKMVLDDKPGRDVTIGYIRAGKRHEVEVHLVQGTALSVPAVIPDLPFAPGLPKPTADDELINDGPTDKTSWTTFEALTIKKLDDGRYTAEINFRDRDKQLIKREYTGSREEIRKAVKADKDLPADEREHLLRSLDQQTSAFSLLPEVLRRLDWKRDLFSWPNLGL